MNKIPLINGFEIFNEVGFYDYLYIKECILKGMRNNISYNETFPLDPLTKPVLIGRFYHNSMENIYKQNSVADLQIAIEEEIKQIQAAVSESNNLKKYGSVSGWNEINKIATFALKEFKKRRSQSGDSFPKIETKLFSKDKILIGKPDMFFVDDSKIILKEFKSSSIRMDNDEINSSYEEQLLFYSILLFDNYDSEKVVGTLETLSGDSFERTILRPEAEEMRFKVLNIINEANNRISTVRKVTELASPHLNSCIRCNKRIICERFKENQLILGDMKDKYVVDCEIKSFDKGPNEKLIDICVLDRFQLREVTLRLPSNHKNLLELNKLYTFSNLIFENGVYKWTDTSGCYLNV